KYSRIDAVAISSSAGLDFLLPMRRFDHGSADSSIPRRDIRAWSHMITHGRCRRDSQTAPWLSDRNDPAFDAKALHLLRRHRASTSVLSSGITVLDLYRKIRAC